MDSLPSDIALLIYTYSDVASQVTLLFTCRYLKGVIMTKYPDISDKHGHAKTLSLLRHCRYIVGPTVCYSAAASGSLHLLKYLREYGCGWDGRVYMGAIEANRMDIIKWIESQSNVTVTHSEDVVSSMKCDYSYTYKKADFISAFNGNLEILK